MKLSVELMRTKLLFSPWLSIAVNIWVCWTLESNVTLYPSIGWYWWYDGHAKCVPSHIDLHIMLGVSSFRLAPIYLLVHPSVFLSLDGPSYKLSMEDLLLDISFLGLDMWQIRGLSMASSQENPIQYVQILSLYLIHPSNCWNLVSNNNPFALVWFLKYSGTKVCHLGIGPHIGATLLLCQYASYGAGLVYQVSVHPLSCIAVWYRYGVVWPVSSNLVW